MSLRGCSLEYPEDLVAPETHRDMQALVALAAPMADRIFEVILG